MSTSGRIDNPLDNPIIFIIFVCFFSMLFTVGFMEFMKSNAIIILIAVALFFFTLFFTKYYIDRMRIQALRALRLADVDNMSGIDFERYVGRLLDHRGFRTKRTKGSGDFGVDLIAHKNGIKYSIQVKRSISNVSRRAVSDAVAGKDHYGCNAAMAITNSYFSKGAIEMARSTGCELIGRDTISKWIIDFQASDT